MLELIKQLLGITDTSQDTIINHYIDSTKKKIINYCLEDTFPAALAYIVIEIVVKKMNGVDLAVKSVSRGDTKTDYQTSFQELEPYFAELANFRRVRVR